MGKVTLLVLLFAMNVQAGPGHGGGGNGGPAGFFKMARYFEREVRLFGSILSLEIDAKKTAAKVDGLRVFPVPGPLLLDGRKVTAINYRDNGSVDLDSESFDADDVTVRYQLVVHELLGLMGIADEGYRLSERLAASTFPLDGSFEVPEKEERCSGIAGRLSLLRSELVKCGIGPKSPVCSRISSQEDAMYFASRKDCRSQLRIQFRW